MNLSLLDHASIFRFSSDWLRDSSANFLMDKILFLTNLSYEKQQLHPDGKRNLNNGSVGLHVEGLLSRASDFGCGSVLFLRLGGLRSGCLHSGSLRAGGMLFRATVFGS